MPYRGAVETDPAFPLRSATGTPQSQVWRPKSNTYNSRCSLATTISNLLQDHPGRTQQCASTAADSVICQNSVRMDRALPANETQGPVDTSSITVVEPFRRIGTAVQLFVAPKVAHVVQIKLEASREKSTVLKYNNAVKKFQAWRSQRANTEVSHSEGRIPEHRAKISETELRLLAHWKTEDVKDRRILTCLAVLYAGRLRPSEGISLRRCHVDLSEDKMVLHIVKDKSNKEGGARKVIQAAGNHFCAVNLMSTWLLNALNSPYVFPNLSETSRPMSYDVARQEWIRVASKLGISSHITLHGFRGGAATQAIADGAPVDEVMRHGRWKHVETLKAYIEASERTTPIASALFKRMRLGPDETTAEEAGVKTQTPIKRPEVTE